MSLCASESNKHSLKIHARIIVKTVITAQAVSKKPALVNGNESVADLHVEKSAI